MRGSSGGGGGGHGGDDTAEADAAEDQEVEVEDFQAHFETGRMSVFEYAPSSIDDLLDLHGEEDPLSETALDLPADADDGDVAGAGELALDPSPAAVVTKQPFSSVTQPVFAHPLSVEPPEPPAESPSTEVDAQSGAETAMPPTPVSAATVPSSAPPGCSSKSTSARYVKRSRVDYSYPLEWIRSHVTAMEALAVELGSQVPHLKQVHRENRSFRASAFKKQAEWQALPVNLHYQLMAVRPHDHTPFTTAAARDAKAKPFTEVIHSVTCGAMTPHMLGHKNGGLYHQESKLVASKVELDKTKQLFADRVRQAGYTKIPPTPAEPFGVYKRLTEIGEKTLKFESLCLSICHRRAYAISQSLSIAVNALLLKLGLCMQGVVPERVCEQWMQCGVLLVFEGLLSVVAHERSMLEDTISAVDALRSFQVRLLPYPDEMHLFEAPPAAETSGEDSAGSTTSTADLPPPPPPPPRPASRSLSRPSSSGVVTALSASTSDTNLNLGSAGSSPTQEIVTTTSAAAAACATSETQPKDDDEGAPSGLSTPPAPAAAPAKPRRPLSISPKPISVPLDGELDLGDININLNINLNLPSFTSPVPSAGPAGTAAGSKGDSTGATPPLPPPQTPPRNLKLELKGREVVIYVPAASLRKLPKQYQLAAYTKGGAVVPFYPVLFTQVFNSFLFGKLYFFIFFYYTPNNLLFCFISFPGFYILSELGNRYPADNGDHVRRRLFSGSHAQFAPAARREPERPARRERLLHESAARAR